MEKHKLAEDLLLFAQTGPAPLVVLPVMSEQEAASVTGLYAALPDAPACHLLCPVLADWEGTLSPWTVPDLREGQKPFTGGAKAFLDRLTETFLPAAKARLAGQVRGILIAGYSMGGLFALWAACESPLFEGAGSFSGSLWFEGWCAYAKKNHPQNARCLVLSLGDREPRSKNPRMAAVGPATEALLADWAKIPVRFWWESGGHFAGPEERTARGIAALCRLWRETAP